VPAALVEMALEPLVRVADRGVPVYIVPGNHERSRIPGHLWTAHPLIHIFHQPETFLWHGRGLSVALAGFPFRRNIRDRFNDLVAETGGKEVAADARLLCLHQAVEGAQVGPSDFTFRYGPDVILGRDIPDDFDAVLSGHIHRGQILSRDLQGRPLGAPVIYPGSIERTSFAERYEDKYYVKLTIAKSGEGERPRVGVAFISLPARPMVFLQIEGGGLRSGELTRLIRERLADLDPDGIVRIKVSGPVLAGVAKVFTAAYVRSLAPSTMNVDMQMDVEESAVRATK